jgi:GxxExxY protein
LLVQGTDTSTIGAMGVKSGLNAEHSESIGGEMYYLEIGAQIIDASIKVHRALGPGLLESAYQTCLKYELQQRGLRVETEVTQPVRYGKINIDAGYRLDMIVENSVIIENKSVEQILPIHKAQLLTYLRLRDYRLGYLINWKVQLIKDGIIRMVNKL